MPARARARVMRLSDRLKNVTHVAVFRDAHSVKHERHGHKDPFRARSIAVHERAVIHINARTAATRWDGGSMDYGIAMDVRDVIRCVRARPGTRAEQ